MALCLVHSRSALHILSLSKKYRELCLLSLYNLLFSFNGFIHDILPRNVLPSRHCNLSGNFLKNVKGRVRTFSVMVNRSRCEQEQSWVVWTLDWGTEIFGVTWCNKFRSRKSPDLFKGFRRIFQGYFLWRHYPLPLYVSRLKKWKMFGSGSQTDWAQAPVLPHLAGDTKQVTPLCTLLSWLSSCPPSQSPALQNW